MIKRRRSSYFFLMLVAAALGIGSRSHIIWLPAFVVAYAGDTLWALFVFLGIGMIAPFAPTMRVAGLAALVSLADEISQLYHPPWLDGLRQTWLGGLVLGYVFQWSDLVCYGVGITMGACTEFLLRRSEEHGTKDTEIPERP